MDMNLNGKVAWVAGATGALGRAISEALAGEGARIAVSSRREDAVAALAADLEAAGHEALALPLDATDRARTEGAARRIVAAWGGIDVLITSMSTQAFGEFLELDRSTFQAAIDTKYHGYIACTQAALPHMMARGGGSIVFITGTGGKMPIGIHMPGGSVNAALNLVVRGIANQYGDRKIRINAVSPGPIRSPRQDVMQDVGAAADSPAARFPLGRFGEPDEVADAAVFLASDRARYITGSVLNVDGGGVLTL